MDPGGWGSYTVSAGALVAGCYLPLRERDLGRAGLGWALVRAGPRREAAEGRVGADWDGC